MPTNREVSELLKMVAAVCQVRDKDVFRTRAYENAAAAIENLTIDVETLARGNRLKEIPGVGDSLEEYLQELFEKGHVRHFDSELKRVPAGMFSLMSIRGIGPKTAYKISTIFRLNDAKTAKSKLKTLIKEGKIAKLPRMGELSEKKIKNAISNNLRGKQRLILSEAIEIADHYLQFLAKSKKIIQTAPLGSLRRRNSTVGDIDVAFSAKCSVEAMKYALSYPEIKNIVSQGEAVSHVQLKNGREMDVKCAKPEQWGSLLQHYTGSKLHNINLRTYALGKGLSLSEYGIKNSKGKVFEFPEEVGFYEKLGLQYIPPELREGEEELEKAKNNQIPYLIQLSDIRGDLHIHSDFEFACSHDFGRSPLSHILDFAIENRYEYIGISDHNPRTSDLSLSARKKIINDRKKYLQEEHFEYENSVKTKIPRLLIGMEVDIRPDGELALEDELMELFDYTIVSIHSSFEQDKDKNTKRIIKALSHPKATIFGHPTGRLLNIRNGISADWGEIINFAAKNNKIMEINSSPHRQDLPDDLVKEATQAKVKMIINTDSHEAAQLSGMRYGVWVARRGWCQKADVINTFSWSDLHSVLNLNS